MSLVFLNLGAITTQTLCKAVYLQHASKLVPEYLFYFLSYKLFFIVEPLLIALFFSYQLSNTVYYLLEKGKN